MLIEVSLTENERMRAAIPARTVIKGSNPGSERYQAMETIQNTTAMTRNIDRLDIEGIVSPYVYNRLGLIIITSPRFMNGYHPPLV